MQLSGRAADANFFAGPEVPAEFRLRPPADPLGRLSAAAVDLVLSGAVGVATASIIGLSLSCMDLGIWSGLTASCFVFAGRDAVFGPETRSLGKIIHGLNVETWWQQSVPLSSAILRNIQFALLPVSGAASLVYHAIVFASVWDGASQLVTDDGRRAADYLVKSRVVELLGEEVDLTDDCDAAEMDWLLQDLTGLSPSTAALLEASLPYIQAAPEGHMQHQAQSSSANELAPGSQMAAATDSLDADVDAHTRVASAQQVMLRHAAKYAS